MVISSKNIFLFFKADLMMDQKGKHMQHKNNK